MTHPQGYKSYLKVSTDLSPTALVAQLQDTDHPWVIRGFDASKPTCCLIECETPIHALQRLHNLSLDNQVTIEDVSDLVNAIMDMAAAHAIVLSEAWQLNFRDSSVPSDADLSNSAEKLFSTLAEISHLNIFDEDSRGYQRIYSRTFVEAFHRMHALAQTVQR